jgi:hypothetical protein
MVQAADKPQASSKYGHTTDFFKPPVISLWFYIFMCLLIPAFPAGAQTPDGEEFFLGPAAETAMYSVNGAAFGGGLVIGYGYDVGAIGLKTLFFADTGGLSIVETGIFLRFYLPGGGTGLFIQINTEATLFGLNGSFTFPAGAGGISAGISAGWRFPLGIRWYVEPYLRAGYPYVAGAGVSAGVRF